MITDTVAFNKNKKQTKQKMLFNPLNCHVIYIRTVTSFGSVMLLCHPLLDLGCL